MVWDLLELLESYFFNLIVNSRIKSYSFYLDICYVTLLGYTDNVIMKNT